MGVVGMLVVVLAACGASSTTDSTDPPDVAGSDQALVTFEAQWLCDVQRHSYTDLSDMDAARAELMTAYGVAATGYDEFKARLEADPTLRSHVSAAYESTCGS